MTFVGPVVHVTICFYVLSLAATGYQLLINSDFSLFRLVQSCNSNATFLNSGSSYHIFNEMKWFADLGPVEIVKTCNADGTFSTLE